MCQNSNLRTNNRGFTLVELIIVVAIIAVLAAVLVPQYLQYLERSRESNDLQVASHLIDAVSLAIIDPNNDVPSGYIMAVSWATNGLHTTDGTITVDTASGKFNMFSSDLYKRGSYGIALPAGDPCIAKIQQEVRLIMGVDETTGRIADAASAAGNAHDLVFHIDTGTGDVAIASETGLGGNGRFWDTVIGLQD